MSPQTRRDSRRDPTRPLLSSPLPSSPVLSPPLLSPLSSSPLSPPLLSSPLPVPDGGGLRLGPAGRRGSRLPAGGRDRPGPGTFSRSEFTGYLYIIYIFISYILYIYIISNILYMYAYYTCQTPAPPCCNTAGHNRGRHNRRNNINNNSIINVCVCVWWLTHSTWAR